MTVDGRLEKLSQLGFIVMSLAVTAAAVRYLQSPPVTAARPEPPPAIAVGTKLPLASHVTNEGRVPALLAVLSSECRFCTESMPFYKRIAAHPAVAAGRVKFQVVSVQPVDVMHDYLRRHGFAPAAVLTAQETGAYVRGTPSLILTDREGVVTASWSGALPSEEERNVVTTLIRLQEGGSR